jgi:hypothetical protein
MQRTKLNKFVLQIAEDLMLARPSIPLSVAVAVGNYKMANIASQLHVKIDTQSGYGSSTVNIYSLVLASSGVGKNSSLGLVDTFYFSDAFKYLSEEVYPRYKEHAMTKIEDEGQERAIHSWTQSLSNSTTSGMYAYAESFTLCGIGSLNLEVDEIANAVISKAELMEILLTPYDNGTFSPVAKRTDSNSMDIKGLPVNLYCFGNKVRLFEGDNVETSFLKLIDEGYGRRMIFVDDTSVPSRREYEDILNEMEMSEKIKAKREGDRENIKRLISRVNLNKVLPLSRDAMIRYAMIKADGENYILDNKGLEPAVKADMMERNFKVAKLAGVYAFFDGNEEVSGANMDEALEVIEESSKVLRELRKIKPKHMRLLDALLSEEKPVTEQHMLSYNFIPTTWTKKIKEYVDLAKELASERGLLWQEISRKGVSYYSVKEAEDEETTKLDEIDREDKEAFDKKANQDMDEEALMAFLHD